jgi:tetratricopeptide (TPR) repeat protein/transglutaminase-like putative cysteine protease
MRMQIRRFSLTRSIGYLFFLSLMLSQAVDIKAAQQPWEGNAFSANPKAMRSAVEPLVKSSEQSTVVLLDERRITLDASNRATETRRLLYRIGMGEPENWSNLAVAWRPWYQERPTIRARVITAAASQVELDRKTITESPLGESSGDTFNDARVLRGPLPAIAPGAIVETQVVLKDIRPVFEQGIATYIPVGHDVPTLQTRISVEAPPLMSLKHSIRLLPEVKPVRSTSGNKVTVTFQIGRLDPVDPLDILLETPGDPRSPYVAFSTGTSWSAIAETFTRVVENQIGQGNLSAVVKETIGNATSREDIIERILQRVQRKIRYKAVLLGDAAIVPTAPAQTLRLEYGDCKDQAALLIAMLRSAGIEAHMALLSVSSFDVDPELPGFGPFDHAIVYVPGENPLWIDSTSGFSRTGQLPTQDQGRLSLILRPGVNALVRIPEFKARTLEMREVFLAENGPGRVVETTEFFGAAELAQRSLHSQLKTEDLHESLGLYVEGVYATKLVSGIQHTDPADMSVPFKLTFEAKDAGVIQTTLSEGVAVIGLGPLFENVAFLSGIDKDDSAGSKQEKREVEVADTVKEWRYRIVPPIGFRKNAVPENTTKKLGPATLSWEFSTAPDEIVTAILRFDTGKRLYSGNEAAEVAKGLQELEDKDALFLLVTFEQTGEALLAAGKVREALAELRKVADLHPKEAIHRAQIARALVGGGLGEAARVEARRAVELDPSSAIAYQVLGSVLEHDVVGVRFKNGWDREGAAAAYRKAIQLEPENISALSDLAILFEHNIAGQRYAPDADLDQAIELYRTALSKASEDEKAVLQDNLSVALLWKGRFKDVRETAVRTELRLAATAAQDGADTAIREAALLIPDPAQRQAALVQAASGLLGIRYYEQGASMLRAAARGAANAAEILSRAELTSKIKRYEDASLPDSDPGTVVKRVMGSILTGRPMEEIGSFFVKGARESIRERETEISGLARSLGPLAGGATLATARDFFVSVVEFTSEGDDKTGYRVSMKMPGARSASWRVYVVREDGQYRVLTLEENTTALAFEAIRRTDAGENESAKQLLDWAREEVQRTGSNFDQAAVESFFRVWAQPRQNPVDVLTIRSSAAALLSANPEAGALVIPILEKGKAAATDSREREAFNIAHAVALYAAKRFEESHRTAEAIVAETQNYTARGIGVASLLELEKFEEAKELLRRRAPVPPALNGVTVEVRAILGDAPDAQLNRRLAAIEMAQGNFEAAEALLRQVTASSAAQPSDFNNLAWLSLFRDKVTEEDISIALRGASSGQGRSGAALHTLAALYAELGRTAEALQVIYQSMEANGTHEISSSDWYVFGRIYEQLGERDAATAAYGRVKPESPRDPTSTYALAQRRLQSR